MSKIFKHANIYKKNFSIYFIKLCVYVFVNMKILV